MLVAVFIFDFQKVKKYFEIYLKKVCSYLNRLYICVIINNLKQSKMTTEQKIAAEFEALRLIGKKEAQEKVSKLINLDAVAKLKEVTAKVKQYTIEDVTPEGYGN